MELWLCTSRMAHRQVAQKVHAQKITVAKVYLAPNSLSRPWRAVVFPQPQSRVQTRTCRRKDKMIQHLTPSPLRGGLSLTSAHAVSRQAFTRCALHSVDFPGGIRAIWTPCEKYGHAGSVHAVCVPHFQEPGGGGSRGKSPKKTT